MGPLEKLQSERDLGINQCEKNSEFQIDIKELQEAKTVPDDGAKNKRGVFVVAEKKQNQVTQILMSFIGGLQFDEEVLKPIKSGEFNLFRFRK